MIKNKFLYFFVFSNLIIFLILELSANFALRIFYAPNVLADEEGEYDLRLDINPFIEFDKDLEYHIRHDSFTKNTRPYPVALEPENKVPGIISYDLKEGIVRSNRGDILINKWGFRGPYVEKEKPDHIFRIVTLGGSTTAGKHENLETYPRLLERMLNSQSDGRQYYQVLNFGAWGYDSCDLKTIYKKEVVEFDPDMIIIMSGWNDIEKQGQKEIKSINDYCKTNYSILSNSNLYRLLGYWIKTTFQKQQSSNGSIENFKNNSVYYLQNMREIISDAKNRNILVGMVDLPALYATKTSNEILKKLPQFGHRTIDQMNYQLNSGLKMNQLIRQVALDFENTFHVNHSISFDTEFKGIFFSDEIHSTGAGNRLLAFDIYKNIQRVLGEEYQTQVKLVHKSMHKNELEFEYLKSIFTSFEMEDLSSTTCVLIYGMCTFVTSIISVNEYVTNVVNHSLGLFLNFPEEISQPKYFKSLEASLLRAIQMRSDFSPTYWVLSQLYELNGKTDQATNFKIKAVQINPLLQEFSLEKGIKIFRGGVKNNPMINTLDKFIILFNEKLPQGAYKSFYNLRENKLSQRKPLDNLEVFFKAYYQNPTLARSIFERALDYLISVNEFEIALNLIVKLKTIKPEYDFIKIFANYENQINKMKLASAN